MKIVCKSTSALELTANRNDGAMRDVLVGYLSLLLILVALQVSRFWH